MKDEHRGPCQAQSYKVDTGRNTLRNKITEVFYCDVPRLCDMADWQLMKVNHQNIMVRSLCPDCLGVVLEFTNLLPSVHRKRSAGLTLARKLSVVVLFDLSALVGVGNSNCRCGELALKVFAHRNVGNGLESAALADTAPAVSKHSLFNGHFKRRATVSTAPPIRCYIPTSDELRVNVAGVALKVPFRSDAGVGRREARL